jgi:hypothetical protein
MELIRELQRRMACAEAEEKRTIFFGPPGTVGVAIIPLCLRYS